MRDPAIRPGRGDLARLVAGGRPPRCAAPRRTPRSTCRRRAIAPRRLREPRAPARRTRSRARRAAARAASRRTARRGRVRHAAPARRAAASRRSTASSTSATSMSSRHIAIERAAAQVMTLADRVARDGDVVRRPADRCAPAASARRCRRSACRRAAAMCVGPVSPDTISAAPRASATRSAIVVCGDSSAAPSARRDDLLARAPPRRAPTARPTSARAASRSAARDAAEPRRRPALVRPRRARIEQRVAAAGLRRRAQRATAESTSSIGNSGCRRVDAERRQQPRLISTTCRVSRGSYIPPPPGSYASV